MRNTCHQLHAPYNHYKHSKSAKSIGICADRIGNLSSVCWPLHLLPTVCGAGSCALQTGIRNACHPASGIRYTYLQHRASALYTPTASSEVSAPAKVDTTCGQLDEIAQNQPLCCGPAAQPTAKSRPQRPLRTGRHRDTLIYTTTTHNNSEATDFIQSKPTAFDPTHSISATVTSSSIHGMVNPTSTAPSTH